MNPRWLILTLCAVALALVIVPQPPGPLEQTVFLERVAARIERAAMVMPETERAVRHAITSIRRAGPPTDERLADRQKVAIERIEEVFWNRGAAPGDQATAMPKPADGSLQHPIADESHVGQLKPMRPLRPFQPNEVNDGLNSRLDLHP